MYKTRVIHHDFKCGGYTDLRPVDSNDLSVWAEVLKLPDTSAELVAKGKPVLVQTAVVSGTKYKFAFKDGSTVIVWRTWRKDISIVEH
jgi:hypothetical protein